MTILRAINAISTAVIIGGAVWAVILMVTLPQYWRLPGWSASIPSQVSQSRPSGDHPYRGAVQ